MQTPLSDVCTQGIFSNKSPSFIAILLKSQQNNAIFFFWCLPCPGSLIRFMRKEPQHLLPPCSPTQPPTHFWAILHPAQTRAAHALLSHRKKKKSTTHASVRASHSSHSVSPPCTYTHIWQRVTSCRDGTIRSCSLLLWGFFAFFCSLCKTGE